MPMLPEDSTFDSVTESAVERKIDELIDAGWDVLYSDFDVRAFDQWKKSAFSCLSALLGPDHKYTQSFRNYVATGEEMSLLVGGGILTAAKEEMARTKSLSHKQ
jgi:hypothetical protein